MKNKNKNKKQQTLILSMNELSVEHNLNKTCILYREQRVTALMVGILSGLSVFMTKMLKVLFKQIRKVLIL